MIKVVRTQNVLKRVPFPSNWIVCMNSIQFDRKIRMEHDNYLMQHLKTVGIFDYII